MLVLFYKILIIDLVVIFWEICLPCNTIGAITTMVRFWVVTITYLCTVIHTLASMFSINAEGYIEELADILGCGVDNSLQYNWDCH